MRLHFWMNINALLYIAIGIAFFLYAPLMLNFYGILESSSTTRTYWFSTSFARLFGAAIFGTGLLIFSIRNLISLLADKRSLIFVLILINLVGTVVSITQQVSVWGTLMGWITAALFLVMTCVYVFLLYRENPSSINADEALH
jgi:hypothetical protein